MGEHLPCKQGVMSSNLIISTTDFMKCTFKIHKIKDIIISRLPLAAETVIRSLHLENYIMQVKIKNFCIATLHLTQGFRKET